MTPITKHLARTVFLLLLAAPARAVPAFTKEEGVRVSSAVVAATTGAYPALRLYYIRSSTDVYSATTPDGLAWTEEGGVRLSTQTQPALDIAVSSITGLSILPMDAGGFRMLYSVIGTTGAFRIYSATSADALSWTNSTSPVISVNTGLTFAGFPSLIELASGDWRIYYIQDFNGGNQAADRRVFTALSTNEGQSFGSASQVVTDRAGQVAATRRTDGRVRLYYTAIPSGTTSQTTVLSALSTDSNGAAFNAETGVRLSTTSADGQLSFPLVVRSTETYRWRMYYTVTPPSLSTGNIHSALTFLPDPQNLSPALVFKSNAAQQFTITGEIFSAALAAKLTQGGQPDIPGTGLAVVDEQTRTATFDTQNKSTERWDLVVTNDDGQTNTLLNALVIDFFGGDARLTDNLIRPREGTSTKIDVTINIAGHVVGKLYTMDGTLVRTLFDEDRPEGSFNFLWDGRTAGGATVATGIYLLHVTGPKLSVVRKIAVIK